MSTSPLLLQGLLLSCTEPASKFPIFAHVVADETQVVVDAPESASGGTQARFNGGPYVPGVFAFEPCTATSDSSKGVSITVAYFGPTIDFD